MYTLSGGYVNSGTFLAYQGKHSDDTTFTGATTSIGSRAITLSSGDIITFVQIRVSNGTTIDYTFFPMLEVGSSATEYEEYTKKLLNLSFDFDVKSLCELGDYENITVDYLNDNRWWIPDPFKLRNIINEGGELLKTVAVSKVSELYEQLALEVTRATLMKNVEMVYTINRNFNKAYDKDNGKYWNYISSNITEWNEVLSKDFMMLFDSNLKSIPQDESNVMQGRSRPHPDATHLHQGHKRILVTMRVVDCFFPKKKHDFNTSRRTKIRIRFFFHNSLNNKHITKCR